MFVSMLILTLHFIRILSISYKSHFNVILPQVYAPKDEIIFILFNHFMIITTHIFDLFRSGIVLIDQSEFSRWDKFHDVGLSGWNIFLV